MQDTQTKTTIYRISQTTKEIKLDSKFLENGDLEWDERGLLAYLFTREEGWRFSIDDLYCQIPKTGATKLKSLVQRLELKGYIKRTETRSSSGKFMHTVEIFESPEVALVTGGKKFYLIRLLDCLEVNCSVNPEKRIKVRGWQEAICEVLFVGTRTISASIELEFHMANNSGSQKYSFDREQELLSALIAFDAEIV
jgi:hypothetical protein